MSEKLHLMLVDQINLNQLRIFESVLSFAWHDQVRERGRAQSRVATALNGFISEELAKIVQDQT